MVEVKAGVLAASFVLRISCIWQVLLASASYSTFFFSFSFNFYRFAFIQDKVNHDRILVQPCLGSVDRFIVFIYLTSKLEGSFLSFLGGVWLCRKDWKLGEGQVEIKVNPQQ